MNGFFVKTLGVPTANRFSRFDPFQAVAEANGKEPVSPAAPGSQRN
jgi:hypothetical protein